MPHEETTLYEVMALRVFCQGYCIRKTCEEFITNHDSIMIGTYNSELLNGKDTKEMISFVRGKCIDYAYGNNEVLSLELIGKTVISSLLDKFILAVIDEALYKKQKHEKGKLYKLISPNFKYVLHLDEESRYNNYKELNIHERIQLVVDYISGMTDSFALDLHKILLGVSLP